jgi:uncharacterized protein (TIGR00730 family)
MIKRVCVYAGSSFGVQPRYAALAAELGTECARRGLGIVYGGGGVGLMGALADAALAAGGEVIGVIPRVMVAEERAHAGVTRLIPVDTMHERKQQMAELADAFIALPGGIGTLEEVVEAFTWLQLGLHLKPVGLLNAFGFYVRLREFFQHLEAEGFVTREHHAMLTIAEDPAGMLDALASTRHVRVVKPICRLRDLA